LLEALRDAANAGVAFPLSSTHYLETASINSGRQRSDLANVMASISHLRTIRSRRDLLRNQLLIAMHLSFGRPTFPPEMLDPLGVGVHWAFQGVEKILQVHDESGRIIDSQDFPREIRIRATQGSELMILAGPRDDDEVEVLRKNFGYKPEVTVEAGRSRLDWETEFVDLLVDTPPSDPSELRTWIQAREVIHEHIDLLASVFHEYRLPTSRLSGGFGDQEPERQREFITGFFDQMPSVRLATDLKLAIHRNNQRGWLQTDVYDIDAMSIAVPYSAVVVADKATADALRRLKVDQTYGTIATNSIEELVDILPEMVQHAGTLPDASGWDEFSPGIGFDPVTPDRLAEEFELRRGAL
jgi:hypothetical protein